jgi:hypothetical protein
MIQSDDDEPILDVLLNLESAQIELRSQYTEFTRAAEQNQPRLGAAAVVGVCRAGKAIAAAVPTLKKYIADDDRRGGRVAIRSIHELALRAVIVFATRRLARLHALVAQSPHRAQHLFIGRLRTMDDVSALVLGCFASVSVEWTAPKAPGDPVPEPPGPGHHRALRTAQALVVAVSNDSDFRHFLREGIHSFDWPDLGRACAELDAVLRLDMEAPPWALGVAGGSRKRSTAEQAPIAAAVSSPDP